MNRNIYHPKMSIEKRAKQFLPFSTLNGLDAALKQKEWEVETRLRLKDKIWSPEGGQDEQRNAGGDRDVEWFFLAFHWYL